MRVLVVPNTGNERSVAAAREISAWLGEAGHEAVLARDDAAPARLEALGVPASEIGTPGLAVALGGDGTILKAVHLLGGVETPILGVNFGRLGFLCGATEDDLPGSVASAIAGEGIIERRCTLEVSPTMGGRSAGTHHALNEVFVGRSPGMRAVEMAIEIDGAELQRVVCDGVLVATPTGSTAYALSAGGPIVSPDVDGLLLVPVSPHSLAVRPVVLGPGDRVALTFPEASRAGACLVVDGDTVPCRSSLDRVEIARAKHAVSLVKLDGRDFYTAVRESFL